MANTLAERGIPVCAHIGLTPQAINRIGGYFVQGRDTNKQDLMIAEAKALASAIIKSCLLVSRP